MNEISKYLIELARRCTVYYTSFPAARAAMVSGSAAEGVSDLYSDIDLMIYYEVLPTQDELDQAKSRNCGGDRLWQFGSAEAGGIIESYHVNGVECQFAHTTIAAWEAQMAEVLEKFDVESPLQKALSGMLNGIPIYGEEYVARWQARAAAYPDGLRDKMVDHYLNFFPVWQMGDRFFARDASLWFHQIRVETIQKILGVLAGLNRVYFTPFQFKHMSAFVEQLSIAPAGLYARTEILLATEPHQAAILLGAIVDETVSLVEREMPQFDTAPVRRQIERKFEPWQIQCE